MLLTNPLTNILYVVIVFLLVLVFFISLSFFLINLQSGGTQRTVALRNATVVSVAVILLMMLRSANALNLLDLSLMLLFFIGLGFYINKRQK